LPRKGYRIIAVTLDSGSSCTLPQPPSIALNTALRLTKYTRYTPRAVLPWRKSKPAKARLTKYLFEELVREMPDKSRKNLRDKEHASKGYHCAPDCLGYALNVVRLIIDVDVVLVAHCLDG
jgi:hypothetical protein